MFRLKIDTIIMAALALLLAGVPGGHANQTEAKFKSAGLVDVRSIDPSIAVDLVNSDARKNFFRSDFYGGLDKAYMREAVARKLAAAQRDLRSGFPGYSLLIMDAARPRSVSRRMYARMKGTRFEKYVANPERGSMHNYGIAVDITIVDAQGKQIDMGFTPFYKSDIAIYWNYGKLKLFGLGKTQKKNRRLLADVLTRAGFTPLSYEWWHFNGMPKAEARKRYRIIE